jgi:YD repeat-containing protein
MYAVIKRSWMLGLLAVGWCGSSTVAQEEPTAKQPILNVVLIELNTSPEATVTKPVFNDWKYWDKRAGRLISALESVLGYEREAKEGNETGATLFAYRIAAAGLADTKKLRPLIEELNQLCITTERPSLLIIWMPREGWIYLAVHDQHELDAGAAFVMLHAVDTREPDVWLGGALTYPYVAPPCVVRTPAMPSSPRPAEWVSPFEEGTLIVQELLHCVVGVTAQVIVDSILVTLAESEPAGTVRKLLIPTVARIKNTFANFKPSQISLGFSRGGFGIAASFDVPRIEQSFLRFRNNTWRPAFKAWRQGDWGGVLLAPKLTVVLDKSGLTDAMASKAVEAVRGKKSGEFEHEGETYIAVKVPGTAGLSKVSVGGFQLCHVDMTVMGKGRNVVRLERFYDSKVVADSPLGLGWSVEPFALEVGQRVPPPDGQGKVALRPVLIDWRAGARLAYRLEEGTGPIAKSRDSEAIAKYDKVTSSLQPNLTARPDGGYLASFAHGFQMAFSEAGRLEWLGWDEADRVTYVYGGKMLKEIRGAKAGIVLGYDEQGHLKTARSSDGRAVTYDVDDAGRLSSVYGSERGNLSFAYGSDSRLAAVNMGDKKLAANTYDDKGRMLTHRTPRGQSRFVYDDCISRVTVTGPENEDTQYYYDENQRLWAYGATKDKMTLLTYDVTGRVLQVGLGKLITDPSTGAKPTFTLSEVVTPLPRTAEEKKAG